MSSFQTSYISSIWAVHTSLFSLGMVSAMDRAIGKIYKALVRRKMIKNTLVIFLSDVRIKIIQYAVLKCILLMRESSFAVVIADLASYTTFFLSFN